MLVKFATSEVLEIKRTPSRIKKASLSRFSEYDDYRTNDGYTYVRVRAISSRVNKNHDGWPSEELQDSYRTFIGKPIFVDHHNHDPSRARGVIVDAQLHVEDSRQSNLDPYYSNAPDNHKPPTWIELLLEVDAKSFPKLGRAIIDGEIDGVSMGANVEYSKCSHCNNTAYTPEEYCTHIQSKGAHFDYTDRNGQRVSKKSYEDCYKIGFFEISFVFDPADETALVSDIKHSKVASTTAAWRDATPEETGGQQHQNPNAAMQIDDQTGQTRWVNKVEINAINGQIPEWVDSSPDVRRTYDTSMAAGKGHDEAMANARYMMDHQRNKQGAVHTARGNDPSSRMHEMQQPTNMRERIQDRIQGGPSGQAIVDRLQRNDAAYCDACYGSGEKDGQACEICKGEGYNTIARKTADRGNPEPQSALTRAPDDVDTLRQERVCPVCGSTLESGMCEVCSFEEPPEGLDNPDLTKAQEFDEQLKEQKAQQLLMQQEQQQAPAPPQQGMGMASKVDNTNNMNLTNDVNSVRTANEHGQSDGRINNSERALLPIAKPLSDKPKNVKVVKNPTNPVRSHRIMSKCKCGYEMSDSDKSDGECPSCGKKMSSVKTTKCGCDGKCGDDCKCDGGDCKCGTKESTTKTADGATADGGADVQPDNRVTVTDVGAVAGDPEKSTQHENVLKTRKPEGIATDTWSGNEGDSLGQHDPVTPDAFPSGTQGPTETKNPISPYAASVHEGGPKMPDHEPTRVKVDAPLKEEVGDPTKTFGSDDFHITDPITSDEGVGGGPLGVPLSEVRSHIITSMKLAELEVDLGITTHEAKFERAAQLERESVDALNARLDTLNRVKTAGLSRSATSRTAAARMPIMGQRHASSTTAESAITDDPYGDSAVFM